MFEVEDKSNAEFGNLEVIDHFAAFYVRDAVDYFGINDDGVERKQVGNEFTYLVPLKQNRKPLLLREWNLRKLERYYQRILVNFLVETVTDFVNHFKRTADNLARLFLKKQFSVFSVM